MSASLHSAGAGRRGSAHLAYTLLQTGGAGERWLRSLLVKTVVLIALRCAWTPSAAGVVHLPLRIVCRSVAHTERVQAVRS
jgi:hypothetical protein